MVDNKEKKMRFELYTKPNCPLCEKVKVTLNSKNVKYSEIVIGADITREELLLQFPWARYAPIIIDTKNNNMVVAMETLDVYLNLNQNLLLEDEDNA